jgi:hypothetical protein
LNGFFLVAVFAMVGNPFRFVLSLGVRRANWFCVFFRLPSRSKTGL